MTASGKRWQLLSVGISLCRNAQIARSDLRALVAGGFIHPPSFYDDVLETTIAWLKVRLVHPCDVFTNLGVYGCLVYNVNCFFLMYFKCIVSLSIIPGVCQSVEIDSTGLRIVLSDLILTLHYGERRFHSGLLFLVGDGSTTTYMYTPLVSID